MKKLLQARVLLQKKKIKKTGFNKYTNQKYFELSDFLPIANEIFDSLKLYSQVFFGRYDELLWQ